jgi:hypothetical protein
LEVAISSRGILTLARGGQAGARNLRCVGDHAFAPAGAPDVRVVFDVTEGRAIRLTVHDPMPVAKAERR